MTAAPLFFSIIIPTLDRPQTLSACLNAMIRLSYPRDQFEVIVVDDGGAQALGNLLAPYFELLDLTLLKQANQGPGSARNLGAGQAKGNVLVFTDDDTRPRPDWLAALAVQFRESLQCAVVGRVVNGLPKNIFSAASQMLVDYLNRYYNQESGNARFVTSNKLAVPIRLFHELGGFDPSFRWAAGEDRDFADRWIHRGYRIQYDSGVVVEHAHFLTLAGFWRQHFYYGRAAFIFHQKRAGRRREKMKIGPRGFYICLLSYPFRQGLTTKSLWIFFLFFLSQAANASGYFYERLRWQKK